MFDINDRVKELRTLLKLSQVDFCMKVGIKQGTLSDIERKKINVSPKTIEKLEQNLNVSREWLYTGIGYIFNDKDNNEKYGIDVPFPVPDRTYNKKPNSDEGRIKVVAFWNKLLEADKDIEKTIDALNNLVWLKMDLSEYIMRLNTVLNDIDNEVSISDHKDVISAKYIKSALNRLSFLKKHYDNIKELNSSIESVLAFVDHDATAETL